MWLLLFRYSKNLLNKSITIYPARDVLQVSAMRSLVHVFPGQVQHIFIVMSVWESSWRLSLAGISFLSTQLVTTFNCQFTRNILDHLSVVLCIRVCLNVLLYTRGDANTSTRQTI